MTRKIYPSDEADRFLVRLPAEMKPWIAEEARRNRRSINSQFVWMLQQQIEAMKTQQPKIA